MSLDSVTFVADAAPDARRLAQPADGEEVRSYELPRVPSSCICITTQGMRCTNHLKLSGGTIMQRSCRGSFFMILLLKYENDIARIKLLPSLAQYAALLETMHAFSTSVYLYCGHRLRAAPGVEVHTATAALLRGAPALGCRPNWPSGPLPRSWKPTSAASRSLAVPMVLWSMTSASCRFKGSKLSA